VKEDTTNIFWQTYFNQDWHVDSADFEHQELNLGPD